MRQPSPIGRTILGIGCVLAASGVAGVLNGCRPQPKAPPVGGPHETMSNTDHGAAAAAVDAMELLAGDAQPDTEIHLQLSPPRPASSDDSARADVLLVGMRNALLKYADVRLAAADGFEETPGAAGKHTIHHLLNWGWAAAEAEHFNPSRPTSLLYREGADGMLTLVGAMYTAPADASLDELNRRIPVGLARWHQHVNWCTPKAESGAQWVATQDGTQIYGPRSPIATREACEAAGGVFYPRVYGWMVHVTIVGSDDLTVVWRGTPALVSDSTPPPHDTAAHASPTTVAAVPIARVAPARPEKRVLAPIPAANPGLRPGRMPLNATPVAPVVMPVKGAMPAAMPPVAAPNGTAAPNPVRSASPMLAMPATGTFRSAFTQIAYDRYTPSGGGRHPAILLLHDGTGPQPQAVLFHNLAITLTQHGFVVEVVHYFDRTGGAAADANARRNQYRQWAAAVQDALYDVANAPAVDGDKLGILGTGLGATLALTVGAQEARVKAVADYSGSIPVRAAPLITRMPAVLIAHGDQDKGVPLTEAYRIRAICQAVNSPFELEVLKGQGHGFRGPDAQTLHQKTVAFFDQYLKNAK